MLLFFDDTGSTVVQGMQLDGRGVDGRKGGWSEGGCKVV